MSRWSTTNIRSSALPIRLLLLSHSIRLATTESSPCTICRGGAAIGKPEKVVNVPGLFPAPYSCQSLEDLLPFILPDEGAENCQLLRSVGTLCGCPKSENACELCSGATLTRPNNPLPVFADDFGGIVPTCEMVEAFLHSFPDGDATCSASQSMIADYCGCGSSELGGEYEEWESLPACTLCPNGESLALPEKPINITGIPFSSCAQLEEATLLLFRQGTDQCSQFQSIGTMCGCPIPESACFMCGDADTPIAYPDKPVRFLKGQFGGIVPTCELYEAFTHTLYNSSDECSIVQQSSGFCGCPPAFENHCDICKNESPPPEFDEVVFPDDLLEWAGFPTSSEIPITCELIISLQYQLELGSDECHGAVSQRFRCGCNNGKFDYLNTTNDAQRNALVWAPRISGFFSFVGTLAIIIDILREKKKQKHLYNQIMFLMAIFDNMTSIAWMVSTAAIPADDLFPVYGAAGNDGTCTAQGFFIQLGMTSIFYNCSLSLYYMLVVALGWRERKLKKFKYMLLGVPLVIGLSLAFAGIPFYASIIFACHLQTPPFVETWKLSIIFLFVPACASIIFVTIMMFLVYYKVHSQNKKARRWRQPSFRDLISRKSKRDLHETKLKLGIRIKKKRPRRMSVGERMERQVLWQATFYLLNFYTTWTTFLVAFHKGGSVAGSASFQLMVAVLCIYPLQGVMNSFVYFRPRFRAAMSKRKKRREQASSSPKEEEQSSIRLAGSSAFKWSMGHLIARMGGSRRSPSGQSSAQLSKEMSSEEADSVGIGDEDDTNFEPSAFIADERCFSGNADHHNHDDVIQLPRVPETASSCDPEEAKVEVEAVMK